MIALLFLVVVAITLRWAWGNPGCRSCGHRRYEPPRARRGNR